MKVALQCNPDRRLRPLAESLGVAPSSLARVINMRSGISPEMALRLSKALGRSPESWLAMQHNYDRWQARKTADLSGVQKVEFEAAKKIAPPDAGRICHAACVGNPRASCWRW